MADELAKIAGSAEGYCLTPAMIEATIEAAVEMRLVKPAWARFAFPGEAKAAE